jgi:solute carrier family 13 (sodium-dependent dicarboxylate transporter), member 2/3/5
MRQGAVLKPNLKRSVARSLVRPFSFASQPSFTLAALASLLIVAIWATPASISDRPRLALLIFGVAVIGWTLTRFGDATIALTAAVALVLTGVVDKSRLYSALGHELIWLVLAAFVMAAVLRGTTLMQRLALAALRPARSISALFYLLTSVIGVTAFVIPSTAGRAAVLLPVFLALADALQDRRLVRALALLFPSIILLSACASLTGAGAHVVGLEFIALVPGSPQTIGYLEWTLLAMPIALSSSFAAAFLIMRLFLTVEERAKRPRLPHVDHQPLSTQELAVAAIVIATVLLWATSDWHAVGIGVIGLAAALLLTLPGVSGTGLKTALSGVERELILFLAATMVIGDALIASGAAASIAGWLTSTMPQNVLGKPAAAGLLVATAAVLMHLAVVSRSARTAVLIPALVLPVASFGHHTAALILLTVIGTGFSQTLTVSSKPVAIYASIDRPTYTPQDLMALSLALQPVFLGLLLLTAFYWWPQVGFPISR